MGNAWFIIPEASIQYVNLVDASLGEIHMLKPKKYVYYLLIVIDKMLPLFFLFLLGRLGGNCE
ncbi:hypothetical protein JHK87_004291 [Glycine soja]|nr:hypothetical protein JHK87_004291 [Glycine soja]